MERRSSHQPGAIDAPVSAHMRPLPSSPPKGQSWRRRSSGSSSTCLLFCACAVVARASTRRRSDGPWVARAPSSSRSWHETCPAHSRPLRCRRSIVGRTRRRASGGEAASISPSPLLSPFPSYYLVFLPLSPSAICARWGWLLVSSAAPATMTIGSANAAAQLIPSCI